VIEGPKNEFDRWCFPLCPEPYDWHLNWQGLVSSFEWIRQMKSVPQDPVYHAEGDLLIHTRMVVEALISMSSWRSLQDPLYLLLPLCTTSPSLTPPKSGKMAASVLADMPAVARKSLAKHCGRASTFNQLHLK